MGFNKIGISACSNGQKKEYKEKLALLDLTLKRIGLIPIYSKCIYEKDYVFSGTASERAEELHKLYKNNQITAIFDISGGDVANEILPYLDYSLIAKSPIEF